MWKKLFLFVCFAFSTSGYTCSEIENLYDSEILGKRQVQYDSQMCYAFSIAHALSIVTQQRVNPYHVALEFKTMTGNPLFFNELDFLLGARPSDYNSNFIHRLTGAGVCTQDLDQEIERLFKKENFDSALAKKRQAYLSSKRVDDNDLLRVDLFLSRKIVNTVVNEINLTCRENRYYISRLRAIDFSISDEVELDELSTFIDHFLSRENPVIFNTSNKIFNQEAQGYHSMTLVGRRFNDTKRECEYLVLDSSIDKNCSSYGEDAKLDCENGLYWFGISDLFDNGISLIGLR